MTDFRKLLFQSFVAIACLVMPMAMMAVDPATEQDYINLMYTELNDTMTSSTAIAAADIAVKSANIATSIAAILGIQFTPTIENQTPPPRLGKMLEEVYNLFFVDKSGEEVAGDPLSTETSPAYPMMVTQVSFLPLTLLTPATSASANTIANCAALRKALAVEPITIIIEQAGEDDPVIHGPFTLLHTVIHQGSAFQQMGGTKTRASGKLKKIRRLSVQNPKKPVQQLFSRPEDYEPMPEEQASKLKVFFSAADPSIALSALNDSEITAAAERNPTAITGSKDGFDNTILHYATVFNNSKNINTSIIDPLFKKLNSKQKLVALSAQNLWGNTPLHYAAGISNPFSRGDAGLSRPSKTGLTYRFTKDIIADKSADKTAAATTLTTKNLAGLTPLHAATSAKETVGNLNQLLSLLPALTSKSTAGADSVASVLSSATDFFGNTPLHYFLLRAFSHSDESTLKQGNFRIADEKFPHGYPPPGSGYTMESWNDNSNFTNDDQKAALATAIATEINGMVTKDEIAAAKAAAEKIYYENISDELEAVRSAISTKIENRGALAAALAVLLGNIKSADKLADLLRQSNTFGLTALQLLKCSNPDINLADNIINGEPADLATEVSIAQALQEVSLAYLPVHFHPFIGVERVGEGQQGPGGPGGGNPLLNLSTSLGDLVTALRTAADAESDNTRKTQLNSLATQVTTTNSALDAFLYINEVNNLAIAASNLTEALEAHNMPMVAAFIFDLKTFAANLSSTLNSVSGSDAAQLALTNLITAATALLSPATIALEGLRNAVEAKKNAAADGDFKNRLNDLATALGALIPVPEGLDATAVNAFASRATALKDALQANPYVHITDVNNAPLTLLQTAATALATSIGSSTATGHQAFKTALGTTGETTTLIGIAPLPSP